MTDLREVADPLAGELLDGRYRLEECIGEGGMARVYRAEDTLLQRSTAVKIMRGHLDELSTIERARSETTLLAGLNHHALVTLYDAQITADEGSYLVMEFVDGTTLRELIAQGPLDPQLAATLLADIAEALHVAHDAGVVHRDIKPSNVLLGRSPVPGRPWRPKLADFGIAYLVDSTRVTTPGLMVGTIAYLAPEQANGAQPAPPADVYSLGIMMIEALSGARPWADAEGIGTLIARMHTPPSIPQTLPEQWRQLLRGMTATRPDDRPTALEVAVTAASLAGSAPAAPAADLATAPVPVPAAAALAEEAPQADDDAAHTVLMPAPSASRSRARAAARSDRDGRNRRRGLIAAVVAAALLVAALVVVMGVWASGYDAVPEPEPSPTNLVQEQGPSPEPTPVAEEEPVAEEPGTEPVAEPVSEPVAPASGSGSGSGGGNGGGQGGGGGNPNAGPGNNSGGGNGKP
ncbi:serine/threonine-protein kinase [Microbacterium aureliae]